MPNITTNHAITYLSKDDGNGKDNARKQWSDWLNEENNRAAQMTTWNFQI